MPPRFSMGAVRATLSGKAAVPLKGRCSIKCPTPHLPSGSSRLPEKNTAPTSSVGTGRVRLWDTENPPESLHELKANGSKLNVSVFLVKALTPFLIFFSFYRIG